MGAPGMFFEGVQERYMRKYRKKYDFVILQLASLAQDDMFFCFYRL